jgi:hypothetical protein
MKPKAPRSALAESWASDDVDVCEDESSLWEKSTAAEEPGKEQPVHGEWAGEKHDWFRG